MQDELKPLIEEAAAKKELLNNKVYRDAVEQTVALLDSGKLRVAEKISGEWQTHAWVKQAVLLYFSVRQMETIEVGPYEYYDKIPLKNHFADAGVRVVPPAAARYGAFLERGVVMMPSYVNIGAYVGTGTMVDTWATVGSCAQIGARVHLSGGVGIGGVLEPVMARPVVVEDDAFIGSRCIIVEGAVIEEGAVLGANTVITGSSQIIDVRGSDPIVYKGRVPKRSVVVPGTTKKVFPAGEYSVSCALIIGERKESTDKKTTLNDVLREFSLNV